jgi:branched-chain amino acid aminotransferase
MEQILVWKLDQSKKTFESIHFNNYLKSLDEVSKNIPQGAYTTFRTFNHNQVIHLQDHFSRLEETARLAKANVPVDQMIIRDCLRHAIDVSGGEDLRVRITLDLENTPGDVYLSIEKLITPPANSYETGVSVATVEMKRDNPKAKLTNFLTTSEGVRNNKINGFNEVLMVDEHGIILEGLSSNFLAIYNGQIWTEEENVLSGITRKIVLEEAEKIGIGINLRGISFDQVKQIEEAFITSTSRSVLPIHDINHVLIGDGKPGPITQTLMEKYQTHINAKMEKI